MPSLRQLIAVLTIAVAAALAPAAAAAPVETVIQDDAHLLYRSDAEVRAAMEQVRDLGIERVRLTASWSLIAPDPESPNRPRFDAADPAAYPQAGWRWLDRGVRMARETGLEVMIDVAFWAPRWATRGGGDAARPRTDVDAQEFARFAAAVATRYSGSFSPPRVGSQAPPAPPPSQSPVDGLLGQLGARPSAPPPAPPPPGQPLPRVALYTLWNEPNLQDFLLPQWERRGSEWWPRAADLYREMVHAAYPALKAVAPGVQVLIGGTAAVAAVKPGVGSVPPLRFLRALACVDERLRPIATGACAQFRPIPGDGWAHHPYSVRSLPTVDSRHRDNLPVAGTPRLLSTLRSLVRSGRLAPANSSVYFTEYGYETNPPDPRAKFGLESQGPLLAQAEYVATRWPAVKMWAQFMLRDLPGDERGSDWQSGLFFSDGRPKPAAATFRTPTFARCVQLRGRRWVLVWGRMRGAPAVGQAALESAGARSAAWRVKGTWRSAPTARATARAARTVRLSTGDALVRYARWEPGATYRLRWTGPAGDVRVGPALAPASCPGRAAPRRARGRTPTIARAGTRHTAGRRWAR